MSEQINTSELPPSMTRPAGTTRQEWRRKQREAMQPKCSIPTINLVDCPKCGKHRLGKYLGDDGKPLPVSKETTDVRGETRLLDVCGPCADRYRIADAKFIMENFKKIQKALRNRKDGTTDKDFTIDL